MDCLRKSLLKGVARNLPVVQPRTLGQPLLEGGSGWDPSAVTCLRWSLGLCPGTGEQGPDLDSARVPCQVTFNCFVLRCKQTPLWSQVVYPNLAAGNRCLVLQWGKLRHTGLCALSRDQSLCCRMSSQDSESEGIVYVPSGGVPIRHLCPTAGAVGDPLGL